MKFWDRDGRLSFQGLLVIAFIECSLLTGWIVWGQL